MKVDAVYSCSSNIERLDPLLSEVNFFLLVQFNIQKLFLNHIRFMQNNTMNFKNQSRFFQSPLNVLVIGDDPSDAENMIQILREQGIEVHWVRVEDETGYVQALESPKDIILSKWVLPRFNGATALHLLRSNQSEIPIIFIVADDIDFQKSPEVLQDGAVDFLLKDCLRFLGQTVIKSLILSQMKLENEKTAEELAISEAELRALFLSMRDVILVLSRDGIYLQIPQTNPDLLFRPADELLGCHLSDVFPRDQAEEYLQKIQNALDSQQTQYIEYALLIGNKKIWFEASISPISNEKAIWVARDVSYRKLTENQLQLQSAAISSAANAILITDQNGSIEWVNAAFTKLTGYTFDEAYGKKPGDLVKSGVQDSHFYQKMWEDILSGKSWQGEVINRRKDGQLYSEKLTITPVIHENGEIRQFVAIKEDVTEQRQNENIMQSRLRLHDFSINHSLQELLQETLDEIEKLTGSQVGFFHFLSDNQENISLRAWSKRTIEQYCHVQNYQPRYKISQAGVWVDCVWERKPVIHNHFSDLPHKKGMPEGHVNIERELVVPVIRNNKIVAIIGVGNKPVDYSERDVQIVSRLADLAWDITEIKASTESLKVHLKRQEQIAALGRELANYRELSRICSIAENFFVNILGCRTFSVALIDKENQKLEIIHTSDQQILLNPEFSASTEFHQSSPEYQLAIGMRSPIVLASPEQIHNGVYFFKNPEIHNIKIICQLPLVIDDQPIGIIELQCHQERDFQSEDIEWLSVVANQVGLSIQNGKLFSETQQRIFELTTLATIDTAVIEHMEAQNTYSMIINQVVTGLKVDAAVLFLYRSEEEILECACQTGYYDESHLPRRILLGESLAGNTALNRQILHVNFDEPGINEFLLDTMNEEGFREYFGIPLIADSQLIGVLELLHRSPLQPDTNWVRFLKIIANQTAIAVKTYQLYNSVQQANQELLKAYDLTIEGWSKAMDMRDEETENHTKRVTNLAIHLANRLGFKNEQLLFIQRGAMLHDIGKLGVPDRILSKPGHLTEDEWRIMQRHPQFAFNMLVPIEYLHTCLDIPYCHHEKWDGTGYPRKLKGDQIPLAARLFAIVDVYDALTSDRPYRKAWTPEKAKEYIREQSGKHFDPNIVEVFLELLEEY